MIDFFVYFKIIIFFSILTITGITVLKRFVADNHFQVIFFAGLLFGFGLYIFLLNCLSYIIKGTSAFYIALIIQIFSALWIHYRIKTSKLDFPRGKGLFYLFLSVLFWSIFLYQIAAHSIIDGADSTIYYSLAARFIRGDYPIHYPSQPDFIALNHIGGPQLLGATRALTAAPYSFIHAFLAFIFLISVSQILTWIFYKKVSGLFELFTASLPAVAGIITLGSLMLAFPITLQLPHFSDSLLKWLSNLPTLAQSLEPYGAPFDLDTLILFIHRFLALSLFISTLPMLLFPKNKFTLIPLGIIIAAIALVDESVLLVVFIPILIITFFTILRKSIKNWFLFAFLITILISTQGSIITETLLNRYHEGSSVLFFPKDGIKESESYRSYRLFQQDSRLFDNGSFLPFVWFHPAVYLQIFFLLIIALKISLNSQTKPEKKILLWLILLSSIVSLIAYHGIVPRGYTHPNGNRLLALSFYFSGLGIVFCISWLLEKKIKNRLFNLVIKTLIIWILLTSIFPPLIHLFPRKVENFFRITKEIPNPILEWIRININKDQRILALLDTNPILLADMLIAKETGSLTPIWGPKIRSYDSFDMSPIYIDLYYTLNPETLKILGVNYILTNNLYRSTLHNQRQADISNFSFFKPVFVMQNDIVIYEVLDDYLKSEQNIDGTFIQLEKIAPLAGKYFIDYPPNITENVFRILRLLFNNREIYCNRQGAFYNSRIDIDLNNCKNPIEKYDYLLLGASVDPQTVCHCNTTLLWKGFKNGVNFWKTN